jgi:hypothetical protein
VAVDSLKDGLSTRYEVTLETGGRDKARVIELAIQPGSVQIGDVPANKSTIEDEAYELDLASDGIRVRANGSTGLFYGIETLVQLVKPDRGKLWLPTATIIDWPHLQNRFMFWDDNHHLEHTDVLKAILRQAAFYKVNGFVFKLNGHFQYKSAPAVVEPYALSPAELQELTDYALRYHIQLIPYLDGPAHLGWLLKHPEYDNVREYPGSNYELCTTNPDTYKLLEGMYQDLMDANKGGTYFYLSTDEPYFLGYADNAQCREAERAKELGSPGKLLAEFLSKAGGYLHDRGRTVFFWGGPPLETGDVPSVPPYLVAGVDYGVGFGNDLRNHGIREMIYMSMAGWQEYFFPNYYIRPSTERLQGSPEGMFEAVPPGPGRVPETYNLVPSTPDREYPGLMGGIVAGWADPGMHPETMWLGYVTGGAALWHPGLQNTREIMTSFYKLFYGPEIQDMGRLYQLMSEQAQFWKESWELAASNGRQPIWGDWPHTIFNPPLPVRDQTIPLPPTPSGDFLKRDHAWAAENAQRLQLASVFYSQNDELMDLLDTNLQLAQHNRYNIEVYMSIAWLYRQNQEMLLRLQQIDGLLNSAEQDAAIANPRQAIASVDQALNMAEGIQTERNTALQNAVQTWYKSWDPRVAEANGRRYLDIQDDVKEHLPERTVDMSYLVYRELLLPFGKWFDQVEEARNQYATANGLPARTDKLNWNDTKTTARRR